MATIRKQITQYEVSTAIRRSGTPVSTFYERVIILKTAPEYHGLTITVTLAFATSFNSFTTAVVGYYGGATSFNQQVAIWLPVSEFQYYYDMLRNETPVYFQFDYNEANPLIYYITNFKLTTGLEPTGEGAESLSFRALDNLALQQTEA
ncbi:hypothetical protein ACO2Q8_18070 [Larkinella sp. VNQ87]|uniref:hypothetical protein n=1 Tax=Larkinella sp. VNQ87 TaxID=3400921 RepID=UPI003C064D16